MINVVLIEPEIPQNTGNIARTCAITGSRLHLVEPLGFRIDDSKLKRAGLDYWRYLDITYYKNTDSFFEKNKDNTECLYFFTTKAANLYSSITYPDDVYLIFGKETSGIKEETLKEHLDCCVRIPMKNTLRSLNLSNSVAVAVYEVLRQRNFEDLQIEGIFSKFN
jgi:tRNA (cytidine/uridine-2'-O-)-methyltransferase